MVIIGQATMKTSNMLEANPSTAAADHVTFIHTVPGHAAGVVKQSTA